MKTFELPVSDCGCFVVGYITDDTVSSMFTHRPGPAPEFGVIVWYKDEEAAKAAFRAAQDAHWTTVSADRATVGADAVRDIVARFHRNACYPDAMPHELDAVVAALSAPVAGESPAAPDGDAHG